MVVFYKRFMFWLYLFVVMSNLLTIIIDTFHSIRSWTSLVLIIVFIYYAILEIKKYPLHKK